MNRAPSTTPTNLTRQQGFTLLELMTVVGVVAIIAAIAIPQFLTAKKITNEGAAISSLRSISTSYAVYRTRFGAYPTLDDLMARNMIDDTFTGVRRGYFYSSIGVVDGSRWSVVAEPENPGRDGDRYFFLETYASAVVEGLLKRLAARLCAWADGHGLAALPPYSPGYRGWPLTDQHALLDLVRGAGDPLPSPLEVLEDRKSVV